MPFYDFENPIAIIGQLKGAPLSVLLVLIFAGQPVSSSYLSTVTRYSDKTITDATNYLKELGYAVERNDASLRQKGWALADGARQLPFIHSLSTGDYENRKISETGPTTTAFNLDKRNENRIEAVVVNDENRKISETRLNERLLAMRFAGIGEPKASELARLEWADPEYILALYMRLEIEKAKGRKKIQTGLLIHWISVNEAKPRNVTFQYGDRDTILESLGGYPEADYHIGPDESKKDDPSYLPKLFDEDKMEAYQQRCAEINAAVDLEIAKVEKTIWNVGSIIVRDEGYRKYYKLNWEEMRVMEE